VLRKVSVLRLAEAAGMSRDDTQMLASHSRLSLPPETWYLIPTVKRFSIDRPLAAG